MALALQFTPPMVTFAVGVWVGAALGACLMGALWAQDRRSNDGFTPAVMPARVTRRRAVQLH